MFCKDTLFNFLAFLIIDSGTSKKDDDSLIAQLVGTRIKSFIFSCVLEILIFSLTDFINLSKSVTFWQHSALLTDLLTVMSSLEMSNTSAAISALVA